MRAFFEVIFKLTIALSVLMAAGSVAFYFMVYLPDRDQHANTTRAFEAISQEATKRAEQEALQSRYTECLESSRRVYDADWATACRTQNQQQRTDLANCLSRGTAKNLCESVNNVTTAGPECTLYANRGQKLNEHYDASKDRCLQEMKVGIK